MKHTDLNTNKVRITTAYLGKVFTKPEGGQFTLHKGDLGKMLVILPSGRAYVFMSGSW